MLADGRILLRIVFTSKGIPIFPGIVFRFFRDFFFRVFFPLLLLLFVFAFASAFCFCFCFLLLAFASAFAFAFCFCFVLFLLLLLFAFAFSFASAFSSADYLLCIDTAAKLGDKTFTLSFETQLHQSRNEAASAVYI